MSFIEKIHSNVKSPDGQEYVVDLGKYTILIGDNEAGKSAIAESIQLARTGGAYGLLYRDKPVRDGSLLSALVPPGVDECVVRGAVGGEYACSWKLVRGKRPQHFSRNGVEGEPREVLTVAHLRSVLGGSADTQVKFFWEQLCEPVLGADLLDLVPPELQEALVLVCPMDGTLVSLTDMLDKIGKYQREMSSTAKAGLIALETLGTVEAVTSDELAGVWDVIHRATLRDVLKELYLEYKADPTLQAGPILRHLTKMLGGKEAIQRIPLTDDAAGALASALLNQRLTRAAIAAKNGEVRALGLRESLKTLKNVIVSIMLGNLHQATKEFIKRVGRFLPKDEAIHFFVEMSQKSISIGLKRGEETHTALSGSAEARLVAAICAALSDSNDLIVVDDRMWDADTLKKTMTVLEKAPCQVIIMSTIKPKGRKRGAWTYVQVCRTPGEPLSTEIA